MTFDQLLKHYGSQAEIARTLGIEQPSVWGWQKTGVPETRQLEFHRLTNGALKADPAIIRKYRSLIPAGRAA